MIDTCEHLAHLQEWLRGRLLARLPSTTLAVLAGRHEPEARWRTEPAWRAGARITALAHLDEGECRRVLQARGIPEAAWPALARLSRGHPLALALLADVVQAGGQAPQSLAPDIVAALVECFAAHAPTPLHRQALEVCAHARLTTEDLLADVLDTRQAYALFHWLAGLSFVELSGQGLFPHDLVREAITAELRGRSPDSVARMGRAMVAHYTARAAAGSTPADTRAALDLLYLNRHNPLTRAFVHDAAGSVTSELATPEDTPGVWALAGQELGPQALGALQRWSGRTAATLWVVRGADDAIDALMLNLDLLSLPASDVLSDPALAPLHAWLWRQEPLRQGQRVICTRVAAARKGLLEVSPWVNAMQARNLMLWMTDPSLAAFAIVAPASARWLPMMELIDFHPVDLTGFEMDGQQHLVFVHDWRAVPPHVWLDSLGRSAPAGPHPGAATPLLRDDRPLARKAFNEAVKAALKSMGSNPAMAGNALTDSVWIRRTASAGETAVDTLRRHLQQAVQRLAARPRDAKFQRALELTYLRPAGSQELAAERLGLPFGTYRYQLRIAIARVCEDLWECYQQMSSGPRG